ncbi:AAA family ATPase [uncultured Thiodictyon sp.]|uniref:AAA family ATPase n=1 Tax=uncultured Thiodictyon sp. TaxID=1846217 RepID=UPI0025F1E1F0|nr:AAA family ATPase [uncultured Thiodictyon sp.]
MSRFTHLTIRGFRRLVDLDVELRPLTVLLGINGVGKSSVLDAISLLSASAPGRLRERLAEMGGLTNVMSIDRAKHLVLGTRMRVEDGTTLDYSLTLLPTGVAYTIEEERLCQEDEFQLRTVEYIESRGNDTRYFDGSGRAGLLQPDPFHDDLESSLSQAPKKFPAPEELRRHLASATLYHALNVDVRAPVRLPQTMQPADLPGANGETLVSCLYTLRETDKARFEAVEDALRAAFPSFDGLNFPPVAAGTLAMTWRDRAFSRPIYTHQLSEGTLRFLWLATLLQSPGLPAICMIDEPEVSLHPEMLSLLADLLREASQRALVVVATHSDRLVRFLKPEEVLIIDMAEDGAASATWADSLDLDAWLDEYTLDQLWRMGQMGGR